MQSLLTEMRDRFPKLFKYEDNALHINVDLDGGVTINVPDAEVRSKLPKQITLFGIKHLRSSDGIYRNVSRMSVVKGQTFFSKRAQTYMIISLDILDGEINQEYSTYHHIQTPINPTDKEIVMALANSAYGSRGMFQALKHGTLEIEESSGIYGELDSELLIRHRGEPILKLKLVNINDF